MIGSTIRSYGHLRHLNAFAINNNSLGQLVNVIGHQERNYAKKDDNKIAACCKEISQTKGKKVEPWPKPDPPPPAWRCECPPDPQPPNYDPYRIKVPDIVVPPLPPSKAKWTWTGVSLTSGHNPSGWNQGYGPGYQQPEQQQQYDEHGNPIPQEDKDEESLIGILKGFFKGKKDKPSGDAQITGHDQEWNLEYLTEDGRGSFSGNEINVEKLGGMPMQDLFFNSPIVHPDYWKDKPDQKRLNIMVNDVVPRLGYHGKTKYKFAFHEPWKPLDRMSLLSKAEEEESNQSEEAIAAEESEKRVL